MANTLYDSGRTLMLSSFDWAATPIDIYLVKTQGTNPYTVNSSTHDNIDDVPVASRIAGPIALGSKTVVNGAADAADVTFPTVIGDTAQALILCKHTGADATDTLIAYIDTATGLPITPNGGDIIIVWDNGTNRIFKP